MSYDEKESYEKAFVALGKAIVNAHLVREALEKEDTETAIALLKEFLDDV